MIRHGRLAVCLAMTGVLSLGDAITTAQVRSSRTSPSKPKSKTDLSVELLTKSAGSPLAAQQWGKLFQQMNVPVRIRRGTSSDKPDIRESEPGGRRRIVVVGRLDRAGKLEFPGRAFSRAQAAELASWFEELRVYGAQGSPAGKPAWGLNASQFDRLFAALGRPIGDVPADGPLQERLGSALTTRDYRIEAPPEVQRVLVRTTPEARPVRLKGVTQGTGVAALLNAHGLGFRPRRTPKGDIVLVIDFLSGTEACWPVGWDLPKGMRRAAAAPSLFALVDVALDKQPLLDVLTAIETQTELPIFVDHAGAAQNKIDLTSAISYRPRRTSWSLFLKGITNPLKLTRELRVDEKGQPLLFITPVTRRSK